MTKIKLCGLSRPRDILAANQLRPEYIGFVFAPESKRYIAPKGAAELKELLDPNIQAVGVFVNETAETVARLLNRGVIDLAQLHGSEGGDYVDRLRMLTPKPIIQAFRIATVQDVLRAEASAADHILLDAGAGTGTVFDWSLLHQIRRPISWPADWDRRMWKGRWSGFTPMRWTSAPVLRRMGARILKKWRPLWPQSEREREHDQSKGTLRRPRGTVYPRDADERGH